MLRDAVMHRFNLILFVVLFCIPGGVAAEQPKITVDELIARHLASIGDPAARSAAKSRGVAGPLVFRMTRSGAGYGEGKATFLSDGHKLRLVMNLNTANYTGEDVISDGTRSEIASTVSGQRSRLGGFLWTRREIIRDGLIGGVLSTAWPLLDVAATKAVLRYDGLKTVDGRSLHELRYEPRKSDPDLQIKLYFDPESYRHVMTTYEATIPVPQARSINPNSTATNGAATQPLHITLKETFSEFHTVDGLTLPQRWQLQWVSDAAEVPIMDWEINARTVAHRPLDPASFKVP
jgi:hypothetical protein